MNISVTSKLNATDHRILAWLPALLTMCIALQLSFDLLESRFRESSFYISESFIFSSFWWLFFPLLLAQLFLFSAKQSFTRKVLLGIGTAAIHLFIYPALVWTLSILFYKDTFSYWQTFKYALLEYNFILLIFYPAWQIFYPRFKKESNSMQHPALTSQQKPDEFTSAFLVAHGNLRIVIETKNITCFTANPPYLNVHCNGKSYLLNETLKSIATKLNSEIFTRVHKSAIVNITKVQSMKSRLNGDYDLILKDGSQVRLSRNYASAFKCKLEQVLRSP